MKFKSKLLYIIFFLIVLSARAQTSEAIKLYEFEDFGWEQLKLRTHNFLGEISKNPDSIGYFIVSERKYGKYKQRSYTMSAYPYSPPRLGFPKRRLKPMN